MIRTGQKSTAPPDSEGRIPHIKDYWKVIMTKKWILISTFLLVVVSTTVYVLVQTPVYRATCRLLIEPDNLNLMEYRDVFDPSIGQLASESARQSFMETQFELILSPSIVKKTFLKFNIGKIKEFAALKDPVEAFREHFSVTPVSNTRLADVFFEWEDPEMAAKILDSHVWEYINDYDARRTGVTRVDRDALDARAKLLQKEIKEAHTVLQEFISQNSMVSLEKAQDIVSQRLSDLNKNLTTMEQQRIEAESRFKNIQQAVEDGRPLEDMPEITDSATVREMKIEFVRAMQDVSQLNHRFLENHPEVLAAEARLQSITDKLATEVQRFLFTSESEYLRAVEQEKGVKLALNEQEEKVKELNRKLGEYDLLKEDYETTKGTYRKLIEKIEEIDISLAGGSPEKEDNIFIIFQKVPPKPVRPKKAMSVGLAGLIGLILGVGLCFFVEYLDTTIKTKEDVEESLGTPTLGYVPPVHGTGKTTKGKQRPDLAALDKPHSAIAEAFRSIRTSLMFSETGSELRNILVTSPMPSEGKTLVSLNVATVLAQAGKNVLLVDADLRKPRLAAVFDTPTSPGLSNLLARGEDLSPAEAIVSTHLENLSFLPSGPPPPNPAELLGSLRMKELVAEISDLFDFIVYDTPPAVNTTDPAILSQLVQGVVLVLRSFSTEREVAIRARDILAGAQAKILGVVLNNADMPRSGYQGYYRYSYYYSSSPYGSYYSDEKMKTVRKRRRRGSPERAETGKKKVSSSTSGGDPA